MLVDDLAPRFGVRELLGGLRVLGADDRHELAHLGLVRVEPLLAPEVLGELLGLVHEIVELLGLVGVHLPALSLGLLEDAPRFLDALVVLGLEGHHFRGHVLLLYASSASFRRRSLSVSVAIGRSSCNCAS